MAVAQSEDENRDILFHTGNSNNSLGLVLTEKKVAVIHKSQEKIPVLLLSTPSVDGAARGTGYSLSDQQNLLLVNPKYDA